MSLFKLSKCLLVLFISPSFFAQFTLGPTYSPVTIFRPAAIGNLMGGPASELVAIATQGNSSTDGTLTIYIDQGVGPATTMTVSCAGLVENVKLGDMDLDNDLDIVTWSGNRAVSVLLNNNGTFSRTDFAPNASTYGSLGFLLFDIDTDGDLDTYGIGFARWNNGSGGLSAETQLFPTVFLDVGSQDLCPLDADGDGDQDVVWGFVNSPVLFRKNHASVSYDIVSLPSAAGGIMDLCTGDFDGDHRADVVASLDNETVVVWLANNPSSGSGYSAPSVVYSEPTTSFNLMGSLYVLDADGNQLDDILLSRQVTGPLPFELKLTTNYGNGVYFAYPPSITPWIGISAVGDIDADGDDDLFLKNLVGVQTGSDAVYFSPLYTGATQTMTVISGDEQTAATSTLAAAPLVVEVRSTTSGAPSPGVPVHFDVAGGATFASGTRRETVVTDALGRASTSLRGGFSPGRFGITMETQGAADCRAFLNVITMLPPVYISGGGQIVASGALVLQPFVFQALEPNGAPAVGVPVAMTTTRLGVVTHSAVLISDNMGLVSYYPAASTYSGLHTVKARPASSMIFTTTTYLVRKLEVSLSTSSPTTAMVFVTFTYGIQNVPILIVADDPGTLVATTFGTIETSVLAPIPTPIAFLDGIGYFGPPNPFGATTSNGTAYWLQIVNNLPAWIGTALTVQAYAFDANYAFPQSIIVSNAVTIAF